MIWLSTSAFVLALVAVVCGVLALTISLLRTRALEHALSTTASAWSSRLQSADAQLTKTSERLRVLEGQSPAKLAAEVAELSVAVTKNAAAVQRLAGQFHAQKTRHATVANGDTGDDDPDLQALLSLQTAPPAGPQGR